MRYIDADKIDYKFTMIGMDEYAGYRAVAFKSDIDDISTADVVEVKHGEWVFVDDVKDEDARYYCSLCQAGDVHKKEFNVPYCWMCGAKMDGGAE